MTRRQLFVSVAICTCVLGSSLAALTSGRTGIAFEESALSMSRPVPQALSTVEGTAGSKLSIKAVPSLPDMVGEVPAEIGGMLPSAAASADFDEDGTPDLVVAYAGDGTGRDHGRQARCLVPRSARSLADPLGRPVPVPRAA